MKKTMWSAGASITVLAASLVGADAQPRMLTPLPGHAGISHGLPDNAPTVYPTSGTWRALTNGFPGASPDTPLLLTDGAVLVHDACTTNWYKLKPNGVGSYSNGTWSAAGSMPAGYTPLYFASQVLKDGRVIINGGEYLDCHEAWTNLGALYDPVADTWTAVAPPIGWAQIGDAQSAVLTDGTYMLASCCDPGPKAALASITGTTVTWTATGTGKLDSYDEEGWTNLPDGRLLTVDAGIDQSTNHSAAELYLPGTGAWTRTGNTVGRIEDPHSFEIGPAVLLPSGTVFQVGANFSGTANARSNTSIFDPVSRRWSKGPYLPHISTVYYSAEDAPAALLPDGNVLVQLSPGYAGCGTPFCTPSHFWEYDGTGFTRVREPAGAANMAAYEGRMLELPTGQIYWSSDQGNISIYTPQGTPNSAWRPTITHSPAGVTRGSTNNSIIGTLFNGLSLGASYGDDAQTSTNYPLVRITNLANSHVCYARTHDHSRMGISTGGTTSTKFDVPMNCGLGQSSIEVVANGIASAASAIQVN